MWHEKLAVYQESLHLAEALSKAAARWPRGMGYLVDQLRRAMASIVLNISEGNGREGIADRRRFFRIAKGSAAEVSACVDLASAFGDLNHNQSSDFKSRLEKIDRMLWGLIR